MALNKEQMKSDMRMMAEMTERSRNFDPDTQIQSWAGVRLEEANTTPASFDKLRDARDIKAEGNTLYTQQRYREAIEKYKDAMRVFLGPQFVLPSPDYLNARYLALGDPTSDQREVIELTACAGNIAQSYYKMYSASQDAEDLISVIDWVEEIRVMYECLKYSVFPTAPAWRLFHLKMVEYFTVPIRRFDMMAGIYRTLGNTALGATFSDLSKAYYMAPDEATNQSKIIALESTAMRNYNYFGSIRHPEPSAYVRLQVTQPALQIRGAWQRVDLPRGRGKPPGRSCLSSWICDGKLYVGGGMNDIYKEQRDMWCLELATKTWKKLPDFPPIKPSAGLYTSRPMRYWQGKAYLFSGPQKIWIFDCATEKWNSKTTTLRGAWPYPNNDLFAFTSAILEGKLYIFGGDDSESRLGVDIFMELDLTTFRWKHINGATGVVPNRNTPGLRVFTALTAVPEQRKLYLCFGDANRSQAERSGHPSGFHTDYVYNDLWSYSVDTQGWKRERLRGNFPSPRAEHCTVYHPILKRTIVYGGYNADLNSANTFGFAFFSDAFVHDPGSGIWKQVITRGFPTYRAQCALVVDPDTGVTYLYGGWTNSEYYPSKVVLNRTFDDLWQLKLDIVRGGMSEDDFHIDPRTVPHGPWYQCFSCGRFDTTPKKCMAVAAHGIRTVGVIGSGQMGLGIAYVAALRARVPVLLHDRSEAQLKKGLAFMDKLLDKDVTKGKISAEDAKETRGRVTVISAEKGLAGMRDADMVIEAVSEKLSLKEAIFKELSAKVSADTILATNTSSISITKIAAATIPEGQTASSSEGSKSASRVVGLHFFNPVPVMKLVEIISALQTSTDTLDRARNFAVACGKEVTTSQDVPGFVSNALLMPFINEAIMCLEKVGASFVIQRYIIVTSCLIEQGVATRDDIDKTLKLGMNHPMGPLQLADFIGLDTCLAIQQTLYNGTSDSKYRPSVLLERMVDAQWLGKKSGKGFYDYDA
ncbi:hypothetical protein EUX98_g6367 [Antrodiella citrinella]|uniref:3-hydroxyacyl-CoA dehydrogenase NAD binding domain-containing protein n=1 Tax=Antrodiella citrinella TaxID=2447956 RepID=A0A4S4MR22_9APHY|nr:hypothetical protein EUX98_g6367 [Antrodiella citrinella]